jgi:hypothetical protein
VLVVLAYRGWTFGLGTHDKPTLVTIALTADALFFGLVAAVLALAAYWSASGRADLSVEIRFNFSDTNKPVFKVGPPREHDQWRPIEPFKQNRATVVVRNDSRYAARNPWVCIGLHGISLSTAPDGWKETRHANMLGVTELMWEGEIVHGEMPLPLPDLVLSDSCLLPRPAPRIEVTVVADGVSPKVEELYVQGLDESGYEEYKDGRRERAKRVRKTIARFMEERHGR